MSSTQPSSHRVSGWTLCKRDWLATTFCGIFFVGWHFAATREITVSAVLFFTILCVVCHLAGTLVLRLLPLAAFQDADYPIAFLLGYLLVNSGLFLMALALPFGVRFNFAAIAISVAACAAASRMLRVEPSSSEWSSSGGSLRSGSLSVVISLVAATLWAQDSLKPLAFIGSDVIVTHWPDSFFHTRHITAFAGQGLGVPIQGTHAAGEPASFYHYASYMLPAALSAFTGTAAYSVFGSFMLPVGIFLTGLAAYGLGKSFWGEGAGSAATIVLLLLPDAAQQGGHNHFYSYHWLQQVNPGQLFGVAVLSIAWVYMFDACKTGRVASLCASFFFAALCVIYKAQFFVASALLIWVFPAMFFGTFSARRRAVWIAAAVLSYWLTLKFAEGIPSFPTIKLDGSGLVRYSEWIMRTSISHGLESILGDLYRELATHDSTRSCGHP